ncbi:MAG TPA: hypothetical protein VFC19_06565 [Candidatus Limnocylindrales bacterium]|nr:hypothetical protein [Candidatus Limnocylindrales bacterium]
MIMKARVSIVVAAAAITATLMSMPSPASAAADPIDFTAQALASGLTATQSADLQKRVNEVLAAIPGGRQVSATEVRYDGLNVTVDPLFSDESSQAVNAISCREFYFCIDVLGTRFDFLTCRTWALSNWWGWSPFNNNQTWGTVARAYAEDGTTEVWSHTAKGSGWVDVGPWWYFRPC